MGEVDEGSREVKEIELEEEGLGYDYVFKRLPQISVYQLWLFFMANWILICAGSTNVASVILQAQVPYRCATKIDEVYLVKFNETLKYEEGVIFMPGDEHENPSCVQYSLDWTSCAGFDGAESEKWLNDMETCLTNWLENESSNDIKDMVTECNFRVFDQTTYTDTVVSEWDLVCENKWIDPVISSIYLSGNFFGALFFGPLSDKIGRVNGVQVASICLMIVQIAIAFVPASATVWTYAMLRMLSGCFAIGGGGSSFVYTMEIVGVKWRTWLGVHCQTMFAFGYCLLSAIGLLTSWREMMIVLAAMPIFYIVLFFFLLPKSSRFLFSAGKNEEAKTSLRKISKKFPDKNIDEVFLSEVEYSVALNQTDDTQNENVTYTQADLFKRPGMRKITIICMYQWFASSLVYYGLSLGAGSMGGNLLLNNFLNGVVEIVCYILLPSFIDIKFIGRKYGLVFNEFRVNIYANL